MSINRFVEFVRTDTGESVGTLQLGEVDIVEVNGEKRFRILKEGEPLEKIFTNVELDHVTIKIKGTENYFHLTPKLVAGRGTYLVYYKDGTTGEITSNMPFGDLQFIPSFAYVKNNGAMVTVRHYTMLNTSTNELTHFNLPYVLPNQTYWVGNTVIHGAVNVIGMTGGVDNPVLKMLEDMPPSELEKQSNGCFWYSWLRNYNAESDEPNVTIEYGFPGKPSEPQGGDGEMKDTNEPVALTPSDVTNVVYPVRCYRLSKANVSALHGYLWSNDFITNLPKLFSDPFSAIVGIQAIPYISPQNESNVIIGTLDTNIVANKVSIYYVTIDLGSINVTEYWQNFLDYQPYTRLKLFLPYIGIVDLPTDLFMNNSVSVKYRIDIISGACVAIVSNSENIICTFTGNCSTKIPLSNNDHSNAIGNTLVGIAGYAATGNTVAAVANTASIVVGSKERIQISGSLSTAHGILINDKPFLMIERPDTEIPENYAGLKGYTSNISMKLSETSGFTKISDIKLDGLSCTDAEKEELLNMMQNGIYL